MCIQFLSKFERRLKENGVGSDVAKIEIELLKACKEAKGKDERLVSYLILRLKTVLTVGYTFSATTLELLTSLQQNW